MKIIANITIFNLKQFIFVYENGNKIDVIKTNNKDIAHNIYIFYKKYSQPQIILQGAKIQINKIKKELKEKYNILF